jgi:replicative DNA helicase
MTAEEAKLTEDEQRQFDLVVSFLGAEIDGPFEPNEKAEEPPKLGPDARPDVILPEVDPIPLPPQLVNGLDFAIGGGEAERAIWGHGDDVAWAPGEATLIVGNDGVGKTTLAQRVSFGLVGVEPMVLGLEIEPADGRVVYLAADRPKQASRSMWRMLQPLDRVAHGKIREGLLVWRGPPPFDLVKDPAALVKWAQEFGASHMVLDSLGFIAGRLTDDETGSAIAHAFSAASADGVELLALLHPRKASAENRKPNSIADVYGSRWITAACGSVLSLWANHGDPVVEVKHLKQPSGEVGPFLMELDHEHGALTVVGGTDLLGLLREARGGLTAKEAAIFMEGSSDKAREMKARRRLESFVSGTFAYRRQGEQIRGSIREPDRYFATPPAGVQEVPG